MSFVKFTPEDIINTDIVTYPSYNVSLNGTSQTGSIFLEKKYLNAALLNRRYQGYSERLGGFVEKDGPFSSSIEIIDAESGADNKEFYQSLMNLYSFYSLTNMDYTSSFTGSATTNLRVISVPEIYYDRGILTGSFTASDYVGGGRYLYDNGRGGIYSGSLTGTLVGNIFYSEGLVVLKKGDLLSFGDSASQPGNNKWKVSFKGVHTIPVKIFRCRAPAGEFNCSTNSTFFKINTTLSASNRNEKEIIMPNNTTYITKVGLYNDDYELVAIVSLAHPIRKDENQDLLIRARMDF